MLWGGTETTPYPEVPVAEWEYATPWGEMETAPKPLPLIPEPEWECERSRLAHKAATSWLWGVMPP